MPSSEVRPARRRRLRRSGSKGVAIEDADLHAQDVAETPLSYAASQVRRLDPDRFLTALLAPPERREGLMVLYAFNLEIAKTRELVSEAMLGRIRLQWWRETIEGIYGGATPRAHEVVQPLAALIAERQLTRRQFERLIDARERDLEEAPPATLQDLEAYADDSSSALAILALEALGVRDETAMAAAREVGIAWALIGLARALPFHARQRRLYLPADLMAEAGIEVGELLDRGRTAGVADVVRKIAARAADHLSTARRWRGELPREAVPALLPAILADGYLAELRRAGYDPFALDPARKRPLKPLRLALAAQFGRY
jgi:NADH dehydrogenase [ubiquinone] 1 alpha subcomplex assembly factor 6